MSDAIDRWTVGNVTITRVVEFEIGGFPPGFMFAGLTEERVKSVAWLHPHYADPDGTIRYAVQAYIIESQGRRIIVDTCVGNDKDRNNESWNHLKLPFLERLTAAGYPPEFDRRRPLHPPAPGSRRLEHPVGRKQMGPDLPQRALPIWSGRVGALEPGGPQQWRHAANGGRTCRTGRSHGRLGPPHR